ncbi:dockerin type I domain-containing protein [Halalkalicoccus ordinarius]|uniref:dockerin type I domain-containing protein n=1 Tax=Halalkalicoccus ordinarius TaxID=3116651 RepID=UPI00300EF35D
MTGAGLAGTALVGQGVPVSAEDGDWTAIESPTEETLHDAVQTSRGPFAVGGSGYALLRRDDGWDAVLERGPTTESNPLRGVGATDDGEQVWFAGGSGVVGRYNVEDDQLTDHSAPEVEQEDGSTSRKTSTWEAVAVAGETGSETVHLVNGSGEYLNGQLTEEGGVDWGQVIKPGGGSSALGIDFLDDDTGYVCDTTSQVYETTDGGESWETIGIDGAGEALQDIAAASSDEINVAAEDGIIYRYDGVNWTPETVGEATVHTVDRAGDRQLAAGAEGAVYEGDDWTRVDTPAENTLFGAALDDTGLYPDAAVGEGGDIVEHGEYDGESAADPEEPAPWNQVDSPVEETLHDTVHAADRGYAVGGEGYVLERDDTGTWTVVVQRGPTAEGNVLNSVDATELGGGIWFAGGSGVLGEYDTVEGQLTDHSAPEGKTSTWEAVAVSGAAGEETVHLVNGSGEYFSGTKQSDGSMEWGEVVEPGSGSSALGIDFLDDDTGYVCDTTSQVYETTDGGESWETIGIDGASVGLTDVTVRSADEIYVAGGDGSVFRYNGAVWTKHWAGDSELNAIDNTDEEVVTAGAEGTVFERTSRGWATADTDVESTLLGVSLDDTGLAPGIAVGTDGTIVEQDSDEDENADDVLEPIGDADAPPQDLTGDGLYEDINGDGELTEADTQLFYDYLDDPTIQENPEKFDFNGDGEDEIDLLDVQAHYQLVEEDE